MSHIVARWSETRGIVAVTTHFVRYYDEHGVERTAEFDHEPTQTEVDALNARHRDARQFMAEARSAWQTATTSWNAAVALSGTTQAEKVDRVEAKLAAFRDGQVAIMKAMRALGLLASAEDTP